MIHIIYMQLNELYHKHKRCDGDKPTELELCVHEFGPFHLLQHGVSVVGLCVCVSVSACVSVYV